MAQSDMPNSGSLNVYL